jgi:hypothetical protein
MTLAIEEFLRFLLHLLPPGFVRLRNFGVLPTHESTSPASNLSCFGPHTGSLSRIPQTHSGCPILSLRCAVPRSSLCKDQLQPAKPSEPALHIQTPSSSGRFLQVAVSEAVAHSVSNSSSPFLGSSDTALRLFITNLVRQSGHAMPSTAPAFSPAHRCVLDL